MLRRRVLGLLAASTALVGPARAQDDWAKVADAAKKEGKLVIYTASIGSPSLKAVTKAFEQKYGISVELLEARASEVRERVRVEQSAGRFLGDVHHNGSTTTWLMTRDGNFQPHGPIPNIKNIVPPYEADDIRIPAEVISYCLMVNRNAGARNRAQRGSPQSSVRSTVATIVWPLSPVISAARSASMSLARRNIANEPSSATSPQVR